MTTASDRPSNLLSAVSPKALFNALRLLFRGGAPIALLMLVILSLVHLLYLKDPTRSRIFRYLSVDYMIVLEQLKRATTVVRPDVVLIGDSSCLMDVDAQRLSAGLGRSAESLCTLAYVGPDGYAQLLSKLIERDASPRLVVVILNQAGFQRDASWDSWPAFVKNGGIFPAPRVQFPQSALDYIRLDLVERAVYRPLPGRYATYYGGDLQLSRYIATHRGSAVDPNTGMQPGSAVDYSMNQQFTQALASLAAVVRQIGAARVLLMISSAPDGTLTPESELQRAETAKRIAAILGLPENNILDTPASMPNAFFSTVTHLNRRGRQVLTGDVVKMIQQRLP